MLAATVPRENETEGEANGSLLGTLFSFHSIDAHGFSKTIMRASRGHSMERKPAQKSQRRGAWASLGDRERRRKNLVRRVCSRRGVAAASTSFFWFPTPFPRRPRLSFLSLLLPQSATHPTITAIPLGGGGPEGTEEAPAGSGDADADDDFDDASRRGGGGESELARLEETIVCCCFR